MSHERYPIASHHAQNVSKITISTSSTARTDSVGLAAMNINDDSNATASVMPRPRSETAAGTMGNPQPELPLSGRDAAHLPGHWLLARIGKRVLRPGGLKLSLEMLTHAQLTGRDVVELAPGLGRTAMQIIKANPKSYVGVDRDPQAKAIVEQIVAPAGGRCINADAATTGLDEASADVVIGEAMLTMQTDRGKDAVVSEATRLLRPGGCYAIHELGLHPDELPADRKTAIRKDLARAIKVNARPLTVTEWGALLQRHGLEVVWSDTAPMALLNVRRNLADEGIGGALRIIRNLARDKAALQRVLSMKRTFDKYADELCGVALVARKR